LLEDLLKNVHIKKLQEAFKTYQNTSFPPRSARFFALELSGEVGELANLEKKEWRQEGSPELSPISSARFEDEAADVFIALMNYSNAKGIDLEEVIYKKLIKIEERRKSGLMGATLK
jgi:NTP pyrophosphatase (non-canonical NTP hydrolase)